LTTSSLLWKVQARKQEWSGGGMRLPRSHHGQNGMGGGVGGGGGVGLECGGGGVGGGGGGGVLCVWGGGGVCRAKMKKRIKSFCQRGKFACGACLRERLGRKKKRGKGRGAGVSLERTAAS